MIAEGDRLKGSILRLLAEGSTIEILKELSEGPLRPVELEQRLPDVAHSALVRQLGELARRGLVTHERIMGLPTRAYYSLADPGRALLGIPDAAERWERQWSAPARPGPAGTRALRLLADERAMAIVQALAAEPLRPIELERRLPDVSRAATRRRLGSLVLGGILARTGDAGPVRYTLTPGARRLEEIAGLTTQWEWQWASNRPPVTVEDMQVRAPINGATPPATPAVPAPPAPGG
jgi:DNA-binding HxlR family transcriptional regulator